ncbi:protein kinase, partial [bacterium]|nr:protein kinase [bacterium]
YFCRNTKILEKLFDLKITGDEFETYKKNKKDFSIERINSFVRTYAPKYNLAYYIDPNNSIVDRYAPKLEKFYSIASYRDTALIENALSEMEILDKDSGVIITGGFHTYGISEYLKKHGISYYVIAPRITRIDVQNPYISLIQNQETSLEALLEKGFSSNALAVPTFMAEEMLIGQQVQSPLKDRLKLLIIANSIKNLVANPVGGITPEVISQQINASIAQAQFPLEVEKVALVGNDLVVNIRMPEGNSVALKFAGVQGGQISQQIITAEQGISLAVQLEKALSQLTAVSRIGNVVFDTAQPSTQATQQIVQYLQQANIAKLSIPQGVQFQDQIVLSQILQSFKNIYQIDTQNIAENQSENVQLLQNLIDSEVNAIIARTGQEFKYKIEVKVDGQGLLELSLVSKTGAQGLDQSLVDSILPTEAIQETRPGSIAAHYIGGETPNVNPQQNPEITAQISQWNRVELPASLAQSISQFLANNPLVDPSSVERLGFLDITTRIQDIFGAESQKYIQSFQNFEQVLRNFQQGLENLKPGQNSITVGKDKQGRDIVIVLVDQNNLASLATNAITVPQSDKVEIYLPNLIRPVTDKAVEAQNAVNTTVILQLLKHELDEHIEGLSHVESVLLESLLNQKIIDPASVKGTFLEKAGKPAYEKPFDNNVAAISQRVEAEFLNRIERAREISRLTGDESELVALQKYFQDLIANETAKIAEIQTDESLSQRTRDLAVQYAQNITKIAQNMGIQVDFEIAQAGGTLRGFKFLGTLGVGANGIVFLAEKNGQKYAVKLIAPDARNQEALRVFLQQEAENTQAVYGDVYQGEDIGKYENGQNRIFAVPFVQGKTFFDIMKLSQETQKSRLDILIDLLEEYKKLEEKGIIHLDIKLDNFILTDEGSIRIIDFGSSLNLNQIPQSFDQAFVVFNKRFASPELKRLSDILDALKESFKTIKSVSSADISLPEIQAVFQELQGFVTAVEQQALPQTQQTSDAFIQANKILSELLAGRLTQDYQSALTQLEASLLAISYSTLSSKSDVYSFGEIITRFFQNILGEVPAEYQEIRQRAKEIDSTNRMSIDELYASLVEIRQRNAEPVSQAKTAKYIGGETLQLNPSANPALLEEIEGWKQYGFPRELQAVIQQFQQNNPFETTPISGQGIKDRLTEIFGNEASRFVQSFEYFDSVLNRLRDALSNLQPGQTQITLGQDAQNRPIILKLVSQNDLNGIGTNALTIPYADRVEILVPIVFASQTQVVAQGLLGNTINFFQVLKHELDEHVFGFTHTEAVLLESLINEGNQKSISDLSLRVQDEFQRRLDRAVAFASANQGSTNEIQALQSYFKDLIANEQAKIAEIEANTALSPLIKQAAVQYAKNITEFARTMSIKADLEVAKIGGTVRGFKFEEQLSEDLSGVVFRATKNGAEYAVKLINPETADQNAVRSALLRDAAVTQLVYGDVYALDGIGSYENGENQIFAVPFFNGISLRESIEKNTLPTSQTGRLDFAVKLVQEYQKLEKAGVLQLDIKPENILISPTGDIRIVNLGASIVAGQPFQQIDNVQLLSAQVRYSSPELRQITGLLEALTPEFQLLKESASLGRQDVNIARALQAIREKIESLEQLSTGLVEEQAVVSEPVAVVEAVDVRQDFIDNAMELGKDFNLSGREQAYLQAALREATKVTGKVSEVMFERALELLSVLERGNASMTMRDLKAVHEARVSKLKELEELGTISEADRSYLRQLER